MKQMLNEEMLFKQMKTEKERKVYFKKQIEEIIDEESKVERELKKERNFENSLELTKKNLNQVREQVETKEKDEEKMKSIKHRIGKSRQENIGDIQKLTFGLDDVRIQKEELENQVKTFVTQIEKSDSSFRTVYKVL